MRAVSGIDSPASPSGYPVPSHFSWWLLTTGRTGHGNSTGSRIAAPISGCFLTLANSSSVRRPGLSSTYSGTPSLPMSWSRAPVFRPSSASPDRPMWRAVATA